MLLLAHFGSGLIDHNQMIMIAVMAMVDRKVASVSDLDAVLPANLGFMLPL